MRAPTAIAIVLTFAVPASAQEAEETASAEEAPETEESEEVSTPRPGPQKPGDKLVALLGGATGTWKCTLRITQPKADPVELSSTLKIEAMVDGFAYAIDQSTQAKAGAASRIYSVWSQDPMTGKLTEAAWDSKGGAWRGTSVGERNGKTVWAQDGTANGDALRQRTTWTKEGKELKRVTEIRMIEGNRWERIFEETCRR